MSTARKHTAGLLPPPCPVLGAELIAKLSDVILSDDDAAAALALLYVANDNGTDIAHTAVVCEQLVRALTPSFHDCLEPVTNARTGTAPTVAYLARFGADRARAVAAVLDALADHADAAVTP